MADDKPAGSLPTELISEKTFYTLGGASAAVLLTCWAINYVAADVSWMNYKTYRLIGIILSEGLAIVIMYKKRKKDSMKWLFAFLNGLLIFVNASGLNVMTSSYIFNPADTSAKKDGKVYRQFQNDKALEAAIIPLPRMISWWPDEKLVTEYQELRQENSKLVEDNHQLRTTLDTDNEGSKTLLAQKDSFVLVINSMQTAIDEKQKQVDQLAQTIKDGNNDLSKQLAQCFKDRDKKNDELLSCQLSERQLNLTIENLKNENLKLKEQLRNCGGKNLTLAQLLQQVCNKNSKPETRDNKLRQQDFYKRINWAEFCRAFNVWNTVIE